MEMNIEEMGTGSFSDPLRHATGMRQAMDEPKMRIWNSYPSFFQNTIFHGIQDEEIHSLRHGGSFEDRLSFTNREKERGNARLKAAAPGAEGAEDLEDAMRCYEKAAGVLRYVECIRKDWKNDDGSYKGIEDEWLKTDSSALDGDSEEARKARAAVTSCYLNISLVATRLQQLDLAIKACTAVLEVTDSSNVKALYRRAQARVSLHSKNGIEEDRKAAIADLRVAAQLAPQDREVRKLLGRLREDQKAEQQKEKQGFAGLFDRGEVISKETEEGKFGNTPSEEKENKWDLRDPRVQRLLDIQPGPNGFL
eukprot:TRINITY_DN15266_c2_g1_i1.p1 TRINITY_DN15266_c2_g1~~TRINITY_DN15266_c2_g1_i1.p1  ORF type:complete len:309 (+),score=69.19 TRINITY_DN15266_c2_g1_i1:115-1041(+)